MDTLSTIAARRSVKHYDANHVMPAEDEKQILSSAMLSPTAFNLQHWRFVLVKDPAEQISSLLSYLGLESHADCFQPHNNRRKVRTASQLQVRKKIYQGSSEAWKKYESYLKPLIDGLKSY